MWSGWRLAKVQTTTRPDHVWPEVWTKIGKAAQREKNRAKEKPKLDNARRLRGILRNSQKTQEEIGKTYGSREAVKHRENERKAKDWQRKGV